MHIVQAGKYRQLFPAKWEEFTAAQLVKALEYLDKSHIYVAQLQIITMLSNRHFKKIIKELGTNGPNANEYEIQMNAFRETMDFLLTPPTFGKWYFGKLKTRFGIFIGPKNNFENLTIEQFGRADDYYKAYLKHKKEIDLNKFIACLYMPKKWWFLGKTRVFNEKYVGNYTKFSGLNKYVKKAIYLNFSATREAVFGNFSTAFTNGGGESEVNKFGWVGLIQKLSKERQMAPNEYKMRPLLEVLVELEINAIENQQKNDN